MARHARSVKPHRRVGRASQNVLAALDWNLTRRPDEPTLDPRRGQPHGRILGEDLSNEPVSKPVHGSHELRSLSRVIKRLPDFPDHARQIGGGPERVRPELLLKVGLRHGPVAVLDENLEEMESLGEEMDLLAVPKKT